MTFRRFAVSLLSVCSLFACSDDDTIVALNVTAGADVPVVDQLHVTITQGSRKFVYDFKPPIDAATDDAEASIKDSFFERITLPDSFADQDALVQVEALKAGGASFDPTLTDETTVHIEENGVVAAYVKLELPVTVPPETGAGGAGGAGGEAGATSEGGADGTASEGGAGGAAAEGGAGGAATEGGAGGVATEGGAPAAGANG
jgi:hypothetical protein